MNMQAFIDGQIAARTASYSDPEEWADIARTVTDRDGLTVDGQGRYARTGLDGGECARWRALDAKFGTDPRSPLHHDNRCQGCK